LRRGHDDDLIFVFDQLHDYDQLGPDDHDRRARHLHNDAGCDDYDHRGIAH
jgi:hypothetical protein